MLAWHLQEIVLRSMFLFLTPAISEGMATITCNCAMYEVSFQEHLRKHGRNELQATMNWSQNMSWKAQTPWPQQRQSVCTKGSRRGFNALFFPQTAVGFKGKKFHSRGDEKIRDRLEDSQREWADRFESKEICYIDCGQVFYNEW